MSFNTTVEIIEDLKQGKMVIIVDDENRENEGDLVIASEAVRPEDINFMARFGRGLICMTMTEARCAQLNLPLMVRNNTEAFATNFTVSIEAAEGVTTGISAADRAKTVQAAIAKEATPADIVQPGHVFPLMARKGGVLTRAGHTEAGCDLARLAGYEASSVIVEILNEDGSMARRDDLEKFANAHDLKIGTIEDLIAYRLENEQSIERLTQTQIKTHAGEFTMFAYQDLVDEGLHLALVKGELNPNKPALVRVHLQNTLCDVVGSTEFCGWPLRDVMKKMEAEKEGIVVILRPNESPRNVLDGIRTIQKIHNEKEQKGSRSDIRTYGVGAQILLDLGVRDMRIMSAPMNFHALAGFGLNAVEFVTE